MSESVLVPLVLANDDDGRWSLNLALHGELHALTSLSVEADSPEVAIEIFVNLIRKLLDQA